MSSTVSESAAPEPDREAPRAVREPLLRDITAALTARHSDTLDDGEHIRVEARTGDDAAWLRARVGTDARAWQVELFARSVPGHELDGALAVLVDWLDGALLEWARGGRDAWLGLDWDRRAVDDVTLWVRGELRDYEAEAMADRLLAGDD